MPLLSEMRAKVHRLDRVALCGGSALRASDRTTIIPVHIQYQNAGLKVGIKCQ
jgi:hypothetical protein